MSSSLGRRVVCLTIGLAAAACAGGDKDQAKLEAAAGALVQQHDSGVKALDSTNSARPVDTTKLGAAKTESILTKARKRP